MKVYRISTFATPPGTKHRNYAQLAGRKSDHEALLDDHFCGQPYPKKWQRLKLHFHEPLLPRADFYNLGLSNFVCNERVKNAIGAIMESCGEFLSVTIEGEKGDYFIYHVTKCESYIDPIGSIWQCDSREPQNLKSPTSRCILSEPAFDISKLKAVKLFMIPKKTYMYCVEQTGKTSDEEFKASVEYHELSGLRFDLAWDQVRGVVPLRQPPLKESPLVWVTGDGKQYKPTKGK